jgi:hypothetical protein
VACFLKKTVVFMAILSGCGQFTLKCDIRKKQCDTRVLVLDIAV